MKNSVMTLKRDFLQSLNEKLRKIEDLHHQLRINHRSAEVRALENILHNASGSSSMFQCDVLGRLFREQMYLVDNIEHYESDTFFTLSSQCMEQIREALLLEQKTIAVNDTMFVDGASANSAKQLSACRIAIIEDEPVLATLYQEFLQEKCLDLWVFGNAEDAFSGLQKLRNKIDVVITDYHLKDLNGALLIPQLRRTCPNTKIIVCTGDYTRDEQSYLAEGADTVIFKPAQMGEICNIVAGLYSQ